MREVLVAVNSPGPVLITYTSHPKHRNGTPGAAQWSISPGDEVASFRRSEAQRWLFKDVGFGVHVIQGVAVNLGKSRGESAFIALFRGGPVGTVWHGYPEQSQWAAVHTSVAADWHQRGWIRIRVMRQLIKGQPCSL